MTTSIRIKIAFALALSLSNAVSNAQSPAATHTRKPVVAIIADSAGTELTDFVIPRAVLAQSGIAQVVTVASNAASIPLVPSTVRVKADMTFGNFDNAFPLGATYVIVPAMVNRNNAPVRAWLKAQAARGATIVSICEGAWTVADAGLFDGRRATSHWHALDGLGKKYPGTTWVRDARYVVDDHRISTTGVSASLPVSIFLIEQMGGRALADSMAERIGVPSWDASHHTADFAVSKSMYAKGVWDYIAWWRHDFISVPAKDGVDEIAFALTMDAIPRTIRGRPVVQLDSGTTLVGRQGLRFIVDRKTLKDAGDMKVMRLPSTRSPAAALSAAIAQLVAWYGSSAGQLITMGMEIPRNTLR